MSLTEEEMDNEFGEDDSNEWGLDADLVGQS